MPFANEVNYDYQLTKKPHYQYQLVSPASGVNTINPYIAQGGTTAFYIESGIVNLSCSYVEFNFNIPKSATGISNWMHLDGFPFWSGIKVYTRDGRVLYENPYLAQYLNMTSRRFNRIDDVMTWEKPNDAGNGVFNGLTCCNVSNAAQTDDNTRAVLDERITTNYLEPKYFTSTVVGGTGTIGAGSNLKCCMYLGFIKDSILAQDLDISFTQFLHIDVTWAPISNFLFTNTSISDPTTVASADYLGVIAVENLLLRVCTKMDEEIKEHVWNVWKSGKLVVMAPGLEFTQISSVGTNQTIPLNITKTIGQYLKKVIWAPYTTNNTRNFRWLHNNSISGLPGTRITSIQTYLDNKPM